MKFLKKDTISTLGLALFFTVTFSAVLAAGGRDSGAGQAGGDGALSHKMGHPGQSDRYEHQKGVGGTGKAGESGEAEQVQTQE